MTGHIVTSHMTGKTADESVERGIYTIVCTCGWRLEDVRGYKAMAEASDRHMDENR